MQVPALKELARVLKPGGEIRLLEYVRPKSRGRRLLARIWQPWIGWAYGASFDRGTEGFLGEAGLELAGAHFVVADLLKLISARAALLSSDGAR